MKQVFDWLKDKAEINLRKHGVSFKEAATVFEDPFAESLPDTLHSDEHERFLIIGWSHKHRILVVVFREWDNVTHIISARPASRGERKYYESGRGASYLFKKNE